MLSQENEKLEGKLGKEKEKVAKAKEMLRAAQAEREALQEAAGEAEALRDLILEKEISRNLLGTV